MVTARVSLGKVLTSLDDEGRLPHGWLQRTQHALKDLGSPAPWYVRAVVGAGAWLASLLLLAFLGGVNLLSSNTSFVATGLAMVLGAVLLRRRASGDFPAQVALAFSLAGQALFAYGIGSLAGHSALVLALSALIAINGILLWVYPDRIQRFFAVLVITSAIVGLLYDSGNQWALACLAPALATGFLVLTVQQARLASLPRARVAEPIATGLACSALGVTLLSTLYVVPELSDGFPPFFPRPWIATLLFGSLLIYAQWRSLARYAVSIHRPVMPAIYLFTAAAVLAALQAPGVIYAMLLILLGTAHGSRAMRGGGVVCLVLFVGAYLYGIETTLLVKALTLSATGFVLLVSRWALLSLWSIEPGNR